MTVTQNVNRLIIVIASCLFPLELANALDVNIPDSVLEALIRLEVTKPTGAITDTDLATITVLNNPRNENSEPQISSLEGLQHATNLETLRLPRHNVSDLSPLFGISSLIELDLNLNPNVELTDISQLTNLESLHLYDNAISSTYFLNTLTSLQFIDLSANRLQDLSFLLNFSELSYAALGSNHFTTIPNLSSLTNLTTLYLEQNFIDLGVNAAALAQLQKNLTTVNVNSQLSPSVNTSEQVLSFSYRSQTKRAAYVYSRTFWTATANKEWVTLDPESGFKNGELIIKLAENSSGVRRTATISIEEESFDISQDSLIAVSLDPALEKLVRDKLVKPTGTLSSLDLESLTQLTSYLYDAEDAERIKSLEGLEYATNLIELSFLGHSFTDLNPLSTLSKLKRLSIRLNTPINPAPIANLTELVELDLENSGISNLNFVASLTKLERIYADRNQITSLSGIESLSNLLSIAAGDNQITSLNPIENLTKLDSLNFRNNGITSLAPLTNSTSLTDLDLSANPLLSLEPLSSLTNLTNLSINEVPGLDFTSISHFTNLNFLTIRYNGIENIGFLSTLKKLQWLEIDNNHIIDPSPLATLSSLTYLQIYDNHITDISSLESLTPINGISFHYNFIDFTAGAPSVNTVALWRDTHGIDIENLTQHTPYFILDSSIPFFQSEPSAGYIQIDSNSYWTATTDASWLKLSQASGWESITIEVTAAANGGDQDRTATIDFGDEEITITQRFNSAYFTYLESRNIDVTDTSYWPLGDKDGDSDSNLFEYEAGLDLDDSNSYFEYIESIDPLDSNNRILTISKRSDGSDFSLELSTDLKSWTPFIGTNDQNSDSTRQVTLPPSSNTPYFIRARLDSE